MSRNCVLYLSDCCKFARYIFSMDVLARKSLPERVRHAQAWAERQLSRASQLIRSSSVASTPSLREIRNQ